MKKQIIALLMMMTMVFTAACAPSPRSAAPNAERAMPAPEYHDDGNGGEYVTSRKEENDGQSDTSGERYSRIDENGEVRTDQSSTLTFSLKVDTAAYANVTRYIENGELPPIDAVRTEELLNYFSYDEAMPFGNDPFAIRSEIGPSPFGEGKALAYVRVRARDIERSRLPSSNLTFLIDTSGSMNSYDKLPLLQDAFAMLVETLDKDDIISIVTYAGSSSVLLDSVSGADKSDILRAIYSLQAGGSTAGADGIRTAYQLAERNFMPGGNNRIILASDGDFNVGTSNVDQLSELISLKRESGVYLSVLGFGTGNIRDDIMENLAKNGNGNYSYIDSVRTAQKVLVDERATNMFVVAGDVKCQVEFNPSNVASYRLIGYENRRMSNRDFNDDRKDAGEIGFGADVVVLFELELKNGVNDGSKYGEGGLRPSGGKYGDELFEVRIRYKNPGESESLLMLHPAKTGDYTERNSADFNFAAAVASFGEMLRQSRYARSLRFEDVYRLAYDNIGRDDNGSRSQFLRLLNRCERLIR